MPINGKVMLLIWNDERVDGMAQAIAARRFKKDTEIKEMFEPLQDAVPGMGDMVASELAWKLFLWLETSSLNGKKE